MSASGPVQQHILELAGRQVKYTVRVSKGATRRRIRVSPSSVEVVVSDREKT